MKSLLRDRLDDAIAKTSENGIISSTMQQLSEWCAFLDYCERTPLRLSEDLGFKQEDGTIHPLWLVGYGTFGEAKSNAILSVPSESWSQELYFLADKWMGDYVQAYPKLRSFFELGDLPGDIGTSAAIMSWSNPKYLKRMNSHHDVGRGMVVFHQFPIEDEADGHCYLNWLGHVAEPEVRRVLLGESKLQWMVENFEDAELAWMDENTETEVSRSY